MAQLAHHAFEVAASQGYAQARSRGVQHPGLRERFGQVHPPDPAGGLLEVERGKALREAGLAGTPQSLQGDQLRALLEARRQSFHIVLAADETVLLPGEVGAWWVRRRVGRGSPIGRWRFLPIGR